MSRAVAVAAASYPAEQYGYGEAKPDRKAPRRSSMKQGAGRETSNLGYETAEPDGATSNKYGYGEAAPTTRRNGSDDRRIVTPDRGGSQPRRASIHSGATAEHVRPQRRRSSMKQEGQSRRASIQYVGEREVELPNTGTKVIRRTSITFREQITVKPIDRVMDLMEHPESLWFQKEEYTSIRTQSRDLVKMVESFGLVVLDETGKSKKPCLRGLENLIAKDFEKKKSLRINAWDSVLDEQDRQMDAHAFDDQAMADALAATSIPSRWDAARRGRQDEQEVQQYLQSTRRMCRRLSC